MIKILFFIDKLTYKGSIGGAEKVLLNLISAMDKEKFDITVQTLYPESLASLLGPKVRYRYCYSVSNNFTQLLYRIESTMGILYQRTVKDDYDVEIAFLESDATKVMAGSTNRKALKLAWVHCDLEVAVNDKEKFVHKTLPWYKKFDKIVCVSEKSKQSFDIIFNRCIKTEVIHNVIDDDEIRLKSNQPLPDGIQKQAFTVLSVGRFFSVKNYLRLLKVTKQLKEEGFDFKVWLVGEGDERPILEKYIKENDLNKTVTLQGYQKNPYPFMKCADLLVCSSNSEGFSTFVSEGIVLGKIIVTTNCSGMNEILGDSEFGLITENTDDAFYEGVRKILLDNDLRNKYEIQAKKRSVYFSRKVLTQQVENFIIQSLKEKHIK